MTVNTDIFAIIASSFGVILSVWGFIWKTNRERKKDINKLFEKKADRELVEEKLNKHYKMIQTQEERLSEHNEKNNIQFKMTEKQIDSVNDAIIKTSDKIEETRVELSSKMDHIQDVIINLINGKK